MAFEAKNTAWVSEDGSYGSGWLIAFDEDSLTPDQWETLGELNDNDKYDYVYAIMAGEPLDEWENN